MKGTEHFKETIKKYLEQMAENDVLFSVMIKAMLDHLNCYSINSKPSNTIGYFGFHEPIYVIAAQFYEENNKDIRKAISNNGMIKPSG